MSVSLLIQLIGLVCWLLHGSFHTKVADSWNAEDGRWCESWMCRKCGKTWEAKR